MGGVLTQWVGHGLLLYTAPWVWRLTSHQQVAGLTVRQRNNSGQAASTTVPLSPSNIIFGSVQLMAVMMCSVHLGM